MTRSALACNTCRQSKLRCIISPNQTTCDRCLRLKISCVYSPKPSQLKKKILKNHSKLKNVPSLDTAITNINHKYRSKSHPLDPLILPSKELLYEIIQEFFHYHYHTTFNFIHKENYLNWINSKNFQHEFFNYDDPINIPEFTPCTLLAILSLIARTNTTLKKMYGKFNQDLNPKEFVPDLNYLNSSHSNCCSSNLSDFPENASSNASKYFAYYSRLLLKDVFDTPSLQRVQSLVLLSSHEWAEGNSTRSYLYLGIAARMGSILGLLSQNGICYNDDQFNVSNDNNNNSNDNNKTNPKKIITAREKFITLESKRRTIWAVFMMDRCNSSGRNRNHAIHLQDLDIPLPCPEENFEKGIEIRWPTYEESFNKFDILTTFNLTIITFELWSKIAKWTGEIGFIIKNKSQKLNFDQLLTELNFLKSNIPIQLKLTKENFNFQVYQLNNLNFGYFHQLLLLTSIFLYREHFYYNNSEHITKLNANNQIKTFIKNLIFELKMSTHLIKKIQKHHQIMLTSPFMSFQIFTNSVTLLSIGSVLHDYELIQTSDENFAVLSQFSGDCELINCWIQLVNQLQTYLQRNDNFKINQSLNERGSKLSKLLNDYGEAEVKERLSINQPQETKRIDLNDILNDSNTSSNDANQTKDINNSNHNIKNTKNNIYNTNSRIINTKIDESPSSSSSQYDYSSTPITSVDNKSPVSSTTSDPSFNSISFDEDSNKTFGTTAHDIDTIFKDWDKIVPYWNDVFVPDSLMNLLNNQIDQNTPTV
ncbi:hypothetical protein WICMUC_000773 [Wickerhamomyces mucosus]|uniref:Zn(2)-C6 fungal-type domain-containing protein n=1 Tax=Wickerhamomyces mucosus TaxID=1378264 RepID=A0A9P8PY29_9ASCO|nr:hypothetical protein WICMUC_000773 [Wickerhamomyces mucosus]